MTKLELYHINKKPYQFIHHWNQYTILLQNINFLYHLLIM